MIGRLWRDDAGQGLPEYALLVAAVVVLVVAVSLLFTEQVDTLFQNIGAFLETNSPG